MKGKGQPIKAGSWDASPPARANATSVGHPGKGPDNGGMQTDRARIFFLFFYFYFSSQLTLCVEVRAHDQRTEGGIGAT